MGEITIPAGIILQAPMTFSRLLMTTFSTELISGKIFGVAAGACQGQLCSASAENFLESVILRLTLGAFHPFSPQEAGGNAIPEEILPCKGCREKTLGFLYGHAPQETASLILSSLRVVNEKL